MTAVSYLMMVTTSKNELELTVAVLNIAGSGQSFYGQSDANGSTSLWLIPNGRKNKQEVISQLEAVPGINTVEIVVLNKPFIQAQLSEVRDLFITGGLDTTNVSDDELFQFIDAKIQGKYTYYIDADFKPNKEGLVKIGIKPLEEHPPYSFDWLRQRNATLLENEDKEITIKDIEICKISTVSGNRRRKNEP